MTSPLHLPAMRNPARRAAGLLIAVKLTIRQRIAKLADFWRLAKPTIEYFRGGLRRPHWLYLEFVNTCNADCIFCAYRYDRREKVTLSHQQLLDAVKQFRAAGGKNVGLSPLLGEVFVDRQAVAKISAISAEGFEWIHTYSNASLFHKFGARNILCSGLTNLRISLPPLDADLYRRIYQNNNYRRVVQNVRDMLIAFSSTPEKTVENLHIEFRSDRSLEACQELPDYIEHVAPFVSENVHVSAMTSFDSWSGAITQDDLLPGMHLVDGEKVGPKRIPCGRMFALQVLSDGHIRQCGCRIDSSAEKDELALGHIDNMTVVEAFNSEKARSNIASFVTGKRLKICETCSWYSPEI